MTEFNQYEENKNEIIHETSTLVFKWRGAEYFITNVELNSTTMKELRDKIHCMTQIIPQRQRVVGLVHSHQIVSDQTLLSALDLKINMNICRFSLIGTPEIELQRLTTNFDTNAEQDCKFNVSTLNEELHQLMDFTKNVMIQFINLPRAGKKLLVLDLDHTLLDFTSREQIPLDSMKRPHMDLFLTEVYKNYDIAIWSQTHWKWVELKITELGILNNPNYNICFILDKTSMFKLSTGKVKPLHLIWSKFPGLWNQKNTLHVDDLSRNFELNKNSGILIAPFYRRNNKKIKTSHRNFCQIVPLKSSQQLVENGLVQNNLNLDGVNEFHHEYVIDCSNDIELIALHRYLEQLSLCDDVSSIDHGQWSHRDRSNEKHLDKDDIIIVP